ncbi:MAG: hypothetical protein ACKVP7_08480 [Hyphomicrobiaceae bacterium]
MSYMIIAVALAAAVGIWFFAGFREKAAVTIQLRKTQAAKRKVFQEQQAAAEGGAVKRTLGGQKRKRGFGIRG